MRKATKICYIIYATITGLLIPFSILVKISSFNNDYYPASFMFFLGYLTIMFISLISFQLVYNSRPVLKKSLRYISVGLVIIALCIQIFWLLDLGKMHKNSTADTIFLIVYIFIGLVGIGSVIHLFKTITKVTRNIIG